MSIHSRFTRENQIELGGHMRFSFGREIKDQLLSVCKSSENLIVGVFDVKKRDFIVWSCSMKMILGFRSEDFSKAGWKPWLNRVDSSEVQEIKERIDEFLFGNSIKNNSAIYLKYHIRSAKGNWYFIKHEMELYSYGNEILAVNYICDYSPKEKINSCFTSRSRKLSSGFEPKLSISAREMDVLFLIADGLSSKEIGNKLCISYNTVISHRQHLLQKFNVQNSAQLIKTAAQFYRL